MNHDAQSTHAKLSRTIFLLTILALFVAIIIPVTAECATGRIATATHAQDQTSALPWPPTCSKQAADTARTFSDPQRKRTPQQSFRLAVLRGDSRQVHNLHDAFSSLGTKASTQRDSKHYQIETLQLALDDAALTNQPAMIEQLIGYGATPNLLTMRPTIPAIMVAAGCGNIQAMEMLHNHGANLSIRAFKGSSTKMARNAIEMAVASRQNAAILWLLGHGVMVCDSTERKRIAFFMQHGVAKGELNAAASFALQCKAK